MAPLLGLPQCTACTNSLWHSAASYTIKAHTHNRWLQS